MAIVSGREKPLANDGRAGHLRGANSAADLFDKLKAGSAATTRLRPVVAGTSHLRSTFGVTRRRGKQQPLMYRKPLTIDKR